MAATIKLRNGGTNDWNTANPVLAYGEFGANVNTKELKVGDGVNTWTNLSAITADGLSSLPVSNNGLDISLGGTGRQDGAAIPPYYIMAASDTTLTSITSATSGTMVAADATFAFGAAKYITLSDNTLYEVDINMGFEMDPGGGGPVPRIGFISPDFISYFTSGTNLGTWFVYTTSSSNIATGTKLERWFSGTGSSGSAGIVLMATGIPGTARAYCKLIIRGTLRINKGGRFSLGWFNNSVTVTNALVKGGSYMKLTPLPGNATDAVTAIGVWS